MIVLRHCVLPKIRKIPQKRKKEKKRRKSRSTWRIPDLDERKSSSSAAWFVVSLSLGKLLLRLMGQIGGTLCRRIGHRDIQKNRENNQTINAIVSVYRQTVLYSRGYKTVEENAREIREAVPDKMLLREWNMNTV